VISTVDPQARHTRKTSAARRDGYKAHVAAEPARSAAQPAIGTHHRVRAGQLHHPLPALPTAATLHDRDRRAHDPRPPARRRAACRPRHATTHAFADSYRRWRPMVERSIAWLVADGCRRVPYHGIERNHMWLSVRVAALNLRWLLILGLTCRDEAWVLA
jgi:hypothetical protein